MLLKCVSCNNKIEIFSREQNERSSKQVRLFKRPLTFIEATRTAIYKEVVFKFNNSVLNKTQVNRKILCKETSLGKKTL